MTTASQQPGLQPQFQRLAASESLTKKVCLRFKDLNWCRSLERSLTVFYGNSKDTTHSEISFDNRMIKSDWETDPNDLERVPRRSIFTTDARPFKSYILLWTYFAALALIFLLIETLTLVDMSIYRCSPNFCDQKNKEKHNGPPLRVTTLHAKHNSLFCVILIWLCQVNPLLCSYAVF